MSLLFGGEREGGRALNVMYILESRASVSNSRIANLHPCHPSLSTTRLSLCCERSDDNRFIHFVFFFLSFASFNPFFDNDN